MEVRMELSRILITDSGGPQLIYLSEPGGRRRFPIEIGTMEAYAIDRRLKGSPTARPMTHDLLASVIEAMGGKLEKIVIDDIRYGAQEDPGTFIATIYIRQDDKVITVDSRPSDAIALGAAFNTPIFVEEKVLEDVLSAPTPPSPQERIMLLRKRLDILSERIEEYTANLEDKDFIASTPSEQLQDYRRQLEQMKAHYEAIRQVLQKLK
jgi:hypothetical protein